MKFNTNKDKGRAGMSFGIAYFGSNGYTVSIPLNDTQWYDFIIEKDGKFQTVQCKATGSQDNSIFLKSCGGTKGKMYDNVLAHPLDFLFCVDSDKNMFLIPVQDIKDSPNKNMISLRTSKTTNNQGFQTYKYLVTF